ncbi:hypothetical protein BC835DRAFT_1417939 [Cytidiella melzeri]|nr:hypothetical protein BC835DRAFT_1417939 [Cytidiella melzeri]
MSTLDPHCTPIKYGIAANETYRQTRLTRSQKQKQHATDMLGRWIGPFSPKKFLTELMEITPEDLAKMPDKVKFVLPRGVNDKDPLEKFLYTAFAKTIDQYGLSPNMQFFISADTPNDVAYKPDAGLREIHRIPPTTPKKPRYKTRSATGASAEAPKPTPSAPRDFDWFHASLMVEFKRHTSDDPFHTKEYILKPENHPKNDLKNAIAFEKDSQAARETRGQLIIYATEMFAHQQRTHLFQLLVCGEDARFICWDHAGAIVSESFNYIKQPSLLAEFFWRHNHMSDEAKGWDPTARLAEKTDENVFREAIDTFRKKERRKLPKIEDTFSGNYPVYEMSVEDEERNMKLLVRRPVFKSTSAVGRATRGYVAVSQEQDHAVLFLKDTWRVNHHLLLTETEVYKLLEKYGVPHVPRLICGGDVKGSDGKAQTTRSEAWTTYQTLPVGYSILRVHTHHRIVQRVAYPIESANNSKEYVTAFCDVVTVIESAHETQPKILHRDISLGNVMLEDGLDEHGVPRALGLLCDWDHANAVAVIPGQEYKNQNYRSGTWAFMSIGMLKNPRKPQELLDDLEAMFWSMLYGALHRFDHTGRKFNMSIFTESRYDTLDDGTSVVVGGDLKSAFLADSAKLPNFKCKPFNRLISALAGALSRYYAAISDVVRAEKNALAADDTELDLDDEVIAARKALHDQHEQVSSPSFWREEMAKALAKNNWIDDALEESPYPVQNEDAETHRFEEYQRSTLSVSKDLDNAARKTPERQQQSGPMNRDMWPPAPAPALLPRPRTDTPSLSWSYDPFTVDSRPSTSMSKRSRDEFEAGPSNPEGYGQTKKFKSMPHRLFGPPIPLTFDGATDSQPTGDEQEEEEEEETNKRVTRSKGKRAFRSGKS